MDLLADNLETSIPGLQLRNQHDGPRSSREATSQERQCYWQDQAQEGQLKAQSRNQWSVIQQKPPLVITAGD